MVQQIDHGEGLVHTHQHLVAGRPAADRQRQVHAARMVAKDMGIELALGGDEAALTGPGDQGFVAAAVGDQVGDGADLQAMGLGEDLQIGQAGHAAVVVHDLADHGGRAQAGVSSRTA